MHIEVSSPIGETPRVLQVRGLFDFGYGAIGLLNSDSPTMPAELMVESAQLLLQPDDRVVQRHRFGITAQTLQGIGRHQHGAQIVGLGAARHFGKAQRLGMIAKLLADACQHEADQGMAGPQPQQTVLPVKTWRSVRTW